MVEARLGIGRDRREPVLRRDVEVGPALLPRARRRCPQEVRPEADAVPDDVVHLEPLHQIPAPARPYGEERACPGRNLGDRLGGDLAAVGAQPPLPPCLAHAGDEERVVARRDGVDGGPHDGALDEPLQSRPQADVARRRILRLQAAEALDRLHRAHAAAFEQQLAGEHRPVQLPLAEHPFRHGRSAAGVRAQHDLRVEPGRIARGHAVGQEQPHPLGRLPGAAHPIEPRLERMALGEMAHPLDR